MNRDEVDKAIKANENLIWKLLHYYKMCEDQDAVSTAFDAAWRACVDYDQRQKAKLQTLMHVYIYNALGSYLRARKTREDHETSLNSQYGNGCTLEDLVQGPEDPQKKVERREANNELKKLVVTYRSHLNEKRRAIFDLWIESDFRITQKEIADALGLSQSYVSNQLSIMKFQLGTKIEQAGLKR